MITQRESHYKTAFPWLEENIGEKLWDISVGNFFFGKYMKAKALKQTETNEITCN